MKKQFDYTKPCKTRDGRTVREVLRLEHPLTSGEVFAAVIEDEIKAFFEDGWFDSHHQTALDLINIPEKGTVEAWAVVVGDLATMVFKYHKFAEEFAANWEPGMAIIVPLTGEYER